MAGKPKLRRGVNGLGREQGHVRPAVEARGRADEAKIFSWKFRGTTRS